MDRIPTRSPARFEPQRVTRAPHLVGGCAAVALLVSALLPWSDPAAVEPPTARLRTAVPAGVAPERVEAASPGAVRRDEPARADLDAVGASIASFDR